MRRADYIFVLDLVEEFLLGTERMHIYGDYLTQLQLNVYHGVYDVVAPEYRDKVWKLISERLKDHHISYVNSGKRLRLAARLFYRSMWGSKYHSTLLYLRTVVRAVYRSMKSAL